MYVISTYEVLPKLLMSKLTSRSYILDREFWAIIGILPPFLLPPSSLGRRRFQVAVARKVTSRLTFDASRAILKILFDFAVALACFTS